MSEARKVSPLLPTALQFGVHAYQQYSCRVPAGTPVEDLTDKAFWAFVVPKIAIGAEIRVIPDDFAYRTLLLCTFTDGFNIRMKVINHTILDDVTPTLDETTAIEYDVVQRGQQKWCVKRLVDAMFIKEMIPTKAEAKVWLDKYLASLDGNADAIEWLKNLEY